MSKKNNQKMMHEATHRVHKSKILLSKDDYLADWVHFHARFEMLYILEGECDAIIDGVAIPKKAGDVIIVNGFQTHWYRPKTERLNAYVLCADDDLYMSDYRQLYGWQNMLLEKKRYGTETSTRIKGILDEWYEKGTADFLRNKGYFCLLLQELLSVTTLYSVEDTKLNGIDILRYVQKHSHENITLQNMAQEMGYTTEYLSRRFNEMAGMNFRSYLNKVRVEKAKELLKDKTKRLSEVISEVGFSNEATYYRALKKYSEGFIEQF